MGRHKKEVDENMVLKLASIGCTLPEIALITDTSPATLKRRFHAEHERGLAMMKQSIRRKQYQKAMEGHPGMLIWMGKQYLGQSDKVEQGELVVPDENRDERARQNREKLIEEFGFGETQHPKLN